MNDLIQPRNKINEMMHETARAGQNDRKILSTLYRMFKSHHPNIVKHYEARLTRLIENRFTRLQA